MSPEVHTIKLPGGSIVDSHVVIPRGGCMGGVGGCDPPWLSWETWLPWLSWETWLPWETWLSWGRGCSG